MSIYISLIVFFLSQTSIIAQEAQNDSTNRGRLKKTEAALDEAALESELAKELGASQDSTAGSGVSQRSNRSKAVRRGSLLNPQISVIGNFFASGTGNNAVLKKHNLGLAEAEIAFNAYVDPYAKADFFVAFHQEVEDPFEGPDSAIAESGGFEAELEEAFLTTLSLPFGLQVKAGKFRSHFGKINRVHPHALNFVDLPRMYVNFLGEEGLADQGMDINWLIPLPSDTYHELTVEVTSGAVESPSFAGGSNNLLYLVHLKNFFDLSENSTLELGFTGVYGANDAAGNKSKIGAVDLTFKWKPLRRNRYQSFEWMTEALISKRNVPGKEVNSRALYSFLRYQIARRWFVGARFDYSEFPDSGNLNEKAYSALLSFFATEFQKIELQFQRGIPGERDAFNRLLLRAVFVIGAHGAHQY